MQLLDESRLFDGRQQRYRHASQSCRCEMHFSVYLPPQAEHGSVPVLYWLSGLTCTDENFSTKAGAQRTAAELGLALVMPDTSPRGAAVAGAVDGDWSFGLGAGFYLNARQQPWAEHYQMYDYVSKELPKLIENTLPLDSTRRSISGHSMGGHGALLVGLSQPQRYCSISALAPICSLLAAPWGQRALQEYIGGNSELWPSYDAVELLKSSSSHPPIMVDQGTADDFLDSQLKPDLLQTAAQQSGGEFELRMRDGYDHGYYFVSSFIEQHLRFHQQYLQHQSTDQK